MKKPSLWEPGRDMPKVTQLMATTLQDEAQQDLLLCPLLELDRTTWDVS